MKRKEEGVGASKYMCRSPPVGVNRYWVFCPPQLAVVMLAKGSRSSSSSASLLSSLGWLEKSFTLLGGEQG